MPTTPLPSGRGWLVRELGWEAAGYGSHLAHLLAGPEMQALIAAVPGVGHVLRPVCRMLGYELTQVTLMVAPEVLVTPIVPVQAGADAAEAAPMAPTVSVPDGGTNLVGVSDDCSVFATGG